MFKKLWRVPEKVVAQRLYVNSLFFSLILCVSACEHNAVKPDVDSGAWTNDFKLVRKNTEKRQKISGSGAFSWVTQDKNLAAPGIVLAEWPNKLRLEVDDPLGSILVLLIINEDKFWWYNNDDPYIVTGPLSRLQESAGIPFQANDLVRAFLARPKVLELDRVKASGNTSASVDYTNGEREGMDWSGQNLEPVKWTKVRPKAQRIEINFEDYEIKFGASFPKKVKLEKFNGPDKAQLLSWTWNDWQPQISAPAKVFQIPQEQHFGRKIKSLP